MTLEIRKRNDLWADVVDSPKSNTARRFSTLGEFSDAINELREALGNNTPIAIDNAGEPVDGFGLSIGYNIKRATNTSPVNGDVTAHDYGFYQNVVYISVRLSESYPEKEEFPPVYPAPEPGSFAELTHRILKGEDVSKEEREDYYTRAREAKENMNIPPPIEETLCYCELPHEGNCPQAS